MRLDAIRDTTVLALAGERDAPPGRTRAALELCPALGPAKKRHHLQQGRATTTTSRGPTWAAEILPLVREAIRSSD